MQSAKALCAAGPGKSSPEDFAFVWKLHNWEGEDVPIVAFVSQSVVERFGLRVYVHVSRYRVLSAMNWGKERMKVFTTCKEEACIWVVPLGNINMKKMGEYFDIANSKPFATPYSNICGYRPTGWSMSSKPSSSNGRNCVTSRQNGNLSIHSVPYSEHSSFPELVDCLRCLRPMTIIPTVSVSKSDEQVETLIKGLRNKQTTLNFRSYY